MIEITEEMLDAGMVSLLGLRGIWFPEDDEDHPSRSTKNMAQIEAEAVYRAMAAVAPPGPRIAELEAMREALHRLSRLGNEPRLGNSVGNMIARNALASTGEE